MSSTVNRNRDIYESAYSPAQLDVNRRYLYDRRMAQLRTELVQQYGHGRDALDLGCGTGSYLGVAAGCARYAAGVDFSRSMLSVAAARSADGRAGLVQADASDLPFQDEAFDLVFSYAALYYVPDLERALREVARVLRPGGVAVLELGNSRSLNSLVSDVQYQHAGWAQPHYVTYADLNAFVERTGLRTVEWRCFQVLPMVGVPRRLALLAPLLLMAWKRLLSLRVRGRMLDERLSTSRLLRRLAFRHLVILAKQ